MPLSVGRPASIAAVDAALARESKELVVVAQRDASIDTPGPNDIFSIGTKAIIKRLARRADLHRVILPKGNEKDLRELPGNVRAEMEFIFAERIHDVLAAAIPS